MFARWYNLHEEDIGEMYFDELLDYCNGVMMFESLSNSRGSVPMTDQSGMMQFNAGIKKQMEGIWSTMFPRSVKYMLEQDKKRSEFKKRRSAYKALEDKINKERGGK